MNTRRLARVGAANGNGPGHGEGDWLVNLLDQAAGYGYTADKLVAALLAQAHGRTDWEQPRPLPGSAPVPPWPGGLGDMADEFVAAVAANTATPPAIAGACVLGVASTVISGAVRIRGGPGWYQPANLYLHCLAASGEGRTPVLEWCRKPLDAIERERREAAAPIIAQAVARKQMAEARLKNLQTQAAKGPKAGKKATEDTWDEADDGEPVEPPLSAEEAVLEAAQEVAEIEVPPMPRLVTREATPEALVGLLDRTNGRLAVMTDEGIGFFENASRYSKNKANFDLYLAGFDGVGYASDRVGRGETYIARVTLVVVLLSQPIVLEELAQDRQALGRGVYARFLWDMPTSIVGGRPLDRDEVPEELVSAWDQRIRSLADQALAVTDQPHVLELEYHARKLFREFRKAHEPRLRPEVGDLAPIVEWGSKLPGNVLRLALGIHALRTGSIGNGFVDEEAMENAVNLGHYYTEHAQATFARMGTGTRVDDAASIRDWLELRRQPVVTKREICRSKDWMAERVHAALETLAEYEYVRRLPMVKGASGRPSEVWQVNPLFLGAS